MDAMVSSTVQSNSGSLTVEANDILDELIEENRRILGELMFANDCLNALIKFKTFIDLNANQFKRIFDSSKYQSYEQLSRSADSVLRRQTTCEVSDDITNDIEASVGATLEDSPQSVECLVMTPRSDDDQGINYCIASGNCNVLVPPLTPITPVIHDTDQMMTDDEQLDQIDQENRFIIDHNTGIVRTVSDKKDNKKRKRRKRRYSESASAGDRRGLKEILFCDINDCNKQYKTQRGLLAHKNSYHLKITPFKCHQPNCQYETGYKRSLEVHVKKHGRKLTVEEQSAGTGLVFEEVTTSHDVNRPEPTAQVYTCTQKGCPKTFTSRHRFERHSLYVHSTDHIYACEHSDCRFWAFRPSQLKMHMASAHQTSALIRCKWSGCDFVALHKQELKEHRKEEHLNNKKYACDQTHCKKRFFSENAMIKHHIRVHNSQQFVCQYPHCGRPYKRYFALKRHYGLVHQSDEPVHIR